jgi:hypothetical protein
MPLNNLVDQNNYEDVLTWAVPLTSALAGFNFSGLFPHTNPVLVATAFGFLAKFLVGLQKTLQSSKNTLPALAEDLAPLIAIALGAFAQALQSDSNWLAYATAFGFFAKALGHLGPNNDSGALEDLLLGLGALLLAYGTAVNNTTLVSLAALVSLIGKTIPSIGTPEKTGGPLSFWTKRAKASGQTS